MVKFNAQQIKQRLQDYDFDEHIGDNSLNPGWLNPSAEHLRAASVMILLVNRPEGLQVLLTQRRHDLKDHPGQIAFPGGKREDTDADDWAAAVRELQEEVGVNPNEIAYVGALQTYITRTGFKISPFVAVTTAPINPQPQASEVAEIFEVPLDFLMNPQNHKVESRVFDGTDRFYYVLGYDEPIQDAAPVYRNIWGATAGMLVAFSKAINDPTELLLQQPTVVTAADILGRDTVRLVGGAVRDLVYGNTPADLDMATTHPPETVMALLKAAGQQMIPTGLAHGTVTLVKDGVPLEITTLRHDVSTDGRHATVAFTDDWLEDAKRRDFTFNAMALTMDGQLIDYFDGQQDLRDGRVVFVGDTRQRIQEDHLRILRYFRFHARFGRSSPDAATKDILSDEAASLNKLSGERIQKEMHGLLALPDPKMTLKLMSDLDIDTLLFGVRFDMEVYQQLVKNEHSYDRPRFIRRLAALLGRDLETITKAAQKLRLSNADKHRLIETSKNIDGPMHETLYRLGSCVVLDKLMLQKSPPAEYIQIAQNWQRPEFPVTGQDLIALGFTTGEELGTIKRQLEQVWIDANFKPSKNTLLAAIHQP